jgi:hypothetical protein
VADFVGEDGDKGNNKNGICKVIYTYIYKSKAIPVTDLEGP